MEKNNIQLLIDTSSKYLILAIFQNGKKLSSLKKENAQKHTENTIKNIDKLLSKNHITKSSVNELYLVIGPGSFVGTRIPILIAKAWKIFNHNIKVYSTSSILFNTKGKNQKLSLDISRRENLLVQTDGLLINKYQIIPKDSKIKIVKKAYENLKIELIPEIFKLEDVSILTPYYFKDATGEEVNYDLLRDRN